MICGYLWNGNLCVNVWISQYTKEKRISITADEAELCQLDVNEMYNIILQYQNDGIYGEDIVD